MVAPSPAPRRRALPVAGAVASVAVVVGGVAVVAATRGGDGDRDHPATASGPVSAYFLGDSATGTRLYAEPHDVAGTGSDRVLAALRVLTRDPDDPDYTTAWPADSFSAASVGPDTITVHLTAAAVRRPRGTTDAAATLGLQQVVHTADAVVGSTLPVDFAADGATTALGQRVTGPLAADTSIQVLAPVNLTGIGEGQSLGDGTRLGGTAGQDVTTVRWSLTAADGTVVRSGRATPDASLAWSSGPIRTTGLAPGSYLLTARTTAVGQTSADPGNYSDTRRVSIQ